MKKILSEAKADIDSGIAKSLSGDKLTYGELLELENLSTVDLIENHEVDILIAQKVVSHVKLERQRQEYQNQLIRDEEFVNITGGKTRSFPFRESLKRRIKRIIKENIR